MSNVRMNECEEAYKRGYQKGVDDTYAKIGKQGRWIHKEGAKSCYCSNKCSECNTVLWVIDGVNYCPNCGAKMRGDDDV